MRLERFKIPPRPPKWGNLQGIQMFLSMRQRLTVGGFAALCLLPSILQIQAPLSELMIMMLGVLAVMGLNPPTRRWLRLFQNVGLSITLMSLCATLTLGNPLQAALVAYMISQLGINRTLQDAHRILLVAILSIGIAFMFDPSAWLLSLVMVAIFGISLIEVWLINALMLPQNRLKPAWFKLTLRPWMIAVLVSIVVLAAIRPFSWHTFDFQRARAQMGLSDHMSPGSIGELLQNRDTAFRVVFDGDAPPVKDWYWRGFVLSRFDGRSWSHIPDPKQLTAIPDVKRTGPIYAYHWMPASDQHDLAFLDPILPTSAVALTSDLTPNPIKAISGSVLMRSQAIEAWPALSPEARERNLEVPKGNPKTRELAQELRAGSKSDADMVFKSLQYFQAHLHYSTRPPLLARNQIDDFLFGTKEGFCEHIASAMVVLLRDANIPARIVNGYQGGHWNEFGKYWQIRQSDAHAWVEVWLSNRHGWVRIDPTAVVMPVGDIRADLKGQGGWFSDMLDWGSYKIDELSDIKAPDLTPSIPSLVLNTKTTYTILGICTVLLLFFIVQLFVLFKAPKDPLDRALWMLERRLHRLQLLRQTSEPWVSFAYRIAPLLQKVQHQPWLTLFEETDQALYGPPLPSQDLKHLCRRLRRFKPKRLKGWRKKTTPAIVSG